MTLGMMMTFRKTPKTQSMKEKLRSWTLLKLEIGSTKDTVKRIKRQATDWEKYLQKTSLIKDCYPKFTGTLKTQQ